MTDFRPGFITFDCYGTLIRFRMSDMAREVFVRDFSAYRLNEVLDWLDRLH